MSDRKANPEGTRPPSGVTVLIVSLGLLRTPTRMATIAVTLRTAAGWLADRVSWLACTGMGRYGVRSSSGAPS